MTRDRFCSSVMGWDGSFVSKDIVAVLAWFPGQTLDRYQISRFGLLDTEYEHEGYIECGFAVKRVVLASGHRHGWTAGKYYASEYLSAPGESYWPVKLFSLSTTSYGDLDDVCSPVTSCVEERSVSSRRQPLFKLSRNPVERGRFLKQLDEWCMSHLDQTYKIVGPGSRVASREAFRFTESRVPVFVRNNDGLCLQAAITNALQAFAGDAVAMQALREPFRGIRSLARATNWIEGHFGRFTTRSILDQRASTNTAVGNIMATQTGVLLVRLEGTDVHYETIEHVVAVDAGRRLILDSAEPFALRMLPGVLNLCVGDGFQLTKIAELRVLVEKPKSKKNWKTHTMSAEKKRRAHQRKREEREVFSRRGRRVVVYDSDDE